MFYTFVAQSVKFAPVFSCLSKLEYIYIVIGKNQNKQIQDNSLLLYLGISKVNHHYKTMSVAPNVNHRAFGFTSN